MKKKSEFVIDLIVEARKDRGTNAAAKRTVKALKGLGLTKEEIILVMSYLDYCKEDGTPYGSGIERCW